MTLDTLVDKVQEPVYAGLEGWMSLSGTAAGGLGLSVSLLIFFCLCRGWCREKKVHAIPGRETTDKDGLLH